jgi:5,6-dimethylbenzimidazole synthase
MRFDDHDLATLLRLMRWRRDVRRFRPDPVPEAALRQLAEAMAFAPSVGNSRPWRVIRVDDPATRAAMRMHFEACNAAAAEGYQGERRDAYRALTLAGIDTAPVQLAVFTDMDPAEGHGLGRRTMPETLAQSTAMAVHALALAARALNLGVGMVSILDPGHVHRLMEAPAGWRFWGWLCIGYPVEFDDRPQLDRLRWQENLDPPWRRR